MPSHLKKMYQVQDPTDDQKHCTDIKVADTVICDDLFIYCTSPDDIVSLTV